MTNQLRARDRLPCCSQGDGLDEEVLRMSNEEIVSRKRLLDNEIRVGAVLIVRLCATCLRARPGRRLLSFRSSLPTFT